MTSNPSPAAVPLRILCLEDNPLIVFHLEQLLEDLGHIYVGAFSSFADLQAAPALVIDGALVDMDLADGCTGPAAAAWLLERDIPTIFVTGQKELGMLHAELSLAVLIKPVSAKDLGPSLALITHRRRGN